MEPDKGQRGLSAALREMRGLTGGFADDISEATEAMKGMDRQASKLSRSLGSSLRSAFDKAVFGGERVGEVLRDLASDLAGKTLDAALRPVQSALTDGIGAAVGSLTGAIGSALGFARGGVVEGGGASAAVRPYARGGVIDRGAAASPGPLDAGAVRAFARGGIVDRPTLFPMRRGTGLMGEAGPEAILPLRRGPDGRLGVGAPAAAAPVVNVRIETPDVESFNRSRGQVSAGLARAVRRGGQRL